MASGTQQLVADYEQVRKLLELYPNIKIVDTEGEPPDQYDIEYTIKGYQTDEDGTPSPVNTHQIKITIPFGYPHFPPTAKPLTPIFHPDIDPDAIRIADFWQGNKSLADLILHIGQMICGNHYQKEEPFNQDAFDWFEERQDWLPFDTLESQDTGKPEEGIESGADESDDITSQTDTGEEITLDAKDSSGKTLDILKDDLTFPFDEDELLDEIDGTSAEDISVSASEEDIHVPHDLEEDSSELITLDDLDTGELDLTEEEEDLTFSLEIDETEDSDELALGDLIGVGENEDTPLAFESEKKSAEDSPLTFESEDQSDTEKGDLPLSVNTVEPDNAENLKEAEELPSIDDDSLAGLDLGDEELPDVTDEGADGGKIRSIQPLVEQKEIYTAKKVLADIPDPGTVQDLEEIQQTIAAAVNEAEELYKKADKLEQAGELEKAGLTLDLVANIAVDYPGLEFARNRIRESMIAGDGQLEDTEAPEKKETGKKKKESKLAVKLPYKVIAVVLVLIGILAGGISVVIKDSGNIKLADTHFRKAEQLLEKKEYKQSQKALNDATSALGSILFLQKGEKDKLYTKIKTIVDSQSFKEGLQGRVLYNGQYVTVEKAKGIDKFNAQMQIAEALQDAGDIEKTIAAYELAIENAKKIDFAEQEKNIHQTINSLRLNQALAAARKAEDKQEWEQAADTYAKALEMSKTLSTTGDKNKIASRLAAASLRHQLTQSQEAFTASKWQETIEMLQRAQNIVEANPEITSASEKKEINKLLINSRLYHILSVAKNAFEKKEWEMAINEYKNATYLLNHNKDVLGDGLPDSIKKIEKTILMTQISREQDQNALAVENNDLETSLKSYRAIAVLIDKSPFQDDQTLKKISNNAHAQTVTLEHEIKINRRIDWLIANSEEIFRKMYPSASSSELLNPQAVFIKEKSGRLIFSMSCVEKRQGRSFRLELNYQYDPKTDSWDIYSGKL